MQNLGPAVKAARRSRGWSQAHLAQAAGLSKRTVIRIESGMQAAGESLMAVGAALDMDLTRDGVVRDGRSLLVDLPPVVTPAWLRKAVAPRGPTDDAPWRIVLVFAALAIPVNFADAVQRAAGPTLGGIWFQAWSLAMFLYACLLVVWLCTEMADDWLSRQDPTRPARISLGRSTGC